MWPILVSLLLVLPLASAAQAESTAPFRFSWASTWAYEARAANVHALEVDSQGSSYILGSFKGTFTAGQKSAEFSAAQFERSPYLLGLSPTGEVRWLRVWEGTNGVLLTDLTLSGSGQLGLGGYFFGPVDFDPSEGSAWRMSTRQERPQGDGGEAFDAVVLALDTEGHFCWVRTWGSESWDRCQFVASDAAGNIAAAGLGRGPLPAAEPTGEAEGGMAALFDLAGEVKWVVRWPEIPSKNPFMDMIMSRAGQVYVLVEMTGVLDCDPGHGSEIVTLPQRTSVILALDARGAYRWQQSWLGEAAQAVRVSGLAAGADGALYANGRYWGSPDFDPGPAVQMLEPPVGGYLLALTPERTLRWVQEWPHSPGQISTHRLSAARDGGVLITGTIRGAGPSSLVAALGLAPAAIAGHRYQGYVVQMRPDGSYVGGMVWGDQEQEPPHALVASDAEGNLYVAGGVREPLAGLPEEVPAGGYLLRYMPGNGRSTSAVAFP